MQDYFEAIQWTMRFSYLVPILLICFNRKNSNAIYNGLVVLTIIAVATEIISEIFNVLYQTAVPAFHIYEILYPLAVISIYTFLFERRFEKRRLYAVMVVYALFGLFSIMKRGVFEYFTFTYVLAQMILMTVSITYLFKLFKEAEVPSLRRHLGFWFSTAILFYNAVTFFVSLFEELVRDNDSNLFHYSWQIQIYVTILFNLVLTTGIWATRKQSS